MFKSHCLVALFVAVICLCISFPAAAQGPPVTDPLSPSPLTKEQIENPPARELKIEQFSEPLKRPLNRPQPSLVEQKFVAILQFVIPTVEGSEARSGSVLSSGNKHYELQNLGGTDFLSPSTNRWGNNPLSTQLERLIANVPEPLLRRAERDFFRSAEVEVGFVTLSNNVPDTRRMQFERLTEGDAPKDTRTIQEFRILGKTVAECEQRSRALVTILDQGFSRPLQLELLSMRNLQAENFAKRQAEYIQLTESLPGLKKSLEEYNDLSNDMLTGLRLQQREAEIKLAGTKARLAAVEKLLAQARGNGASPARILPIEEAKFTAEIEIADLEARQVKALELVNKVSTRIDLSTRIEAAEKSIPLRLRSLTGNLDRLQQLDRDLVRHAPVPLADGKIVIRPVEWTTP